MNRETLRSVILDQHDYKPPVIMERIFQQDIATLSQSPQIIILMGVRRCGKSMWLHYCRQKSAEKNYYLNFDDDRLVEFGLDDFQMLFELFIELFGEERTYFFDEIQNIPGWERFIRRLHDHGYKIYLTGSNANMLSQELGTHLTGRYISVTIYPFSFQEYCQFKGQIYEDVNRLTTLNQGLLSRDYQDYLKIGGFPEHIKTPSRDYLQNLYEGIVYRDIVARYRLPSDRGIRQLGFYLASNLGKEITYNSLSKLLNIPSANTISDYCGYLESVYVCFFISRFSYSLKQQMQSPRKVYFIDLAMADVVGIKYTQDQGRFLENIVFLELKRKFKSIYFHKDTRECDFVVCDEGRVAQVLQVCFSMDQLLETREREIQGLVEAMEAYHCESGLIITAYDSEEITVNILGKELKVSVIPVWKWLLLN